jgi:predicted RNase H-like HicB family nuclease
VNTYEAHVTRDDNWWTISVPDIDGSTQARTISDVTTMAKEYVAGTLDVPLSTVEVHLASLVVDGVGVLGRARQVRAAREQAEQLEAQAVGHACALAHDLAGEGVPVRDIGEVLGVSDQRAHQLVGG